MGFLDDLLGQQGQTPPPAQPQGFDPGMLARLLGLSGQGAAAPAPEGQGPVGSESNPLDIPQSAVDSANTVTPTTLPPPAGAPIPKRQGPWDTAPEAIASANAEGRLSAAQQNEANIKARQENQAGQTMQTGLEAQREAFEQAAKERQDRLKKIQDEADVLKSKVEAFGNEKSDPGRVFTNMSTAGKIGLGLHMAITGFLNPRNPEAVMGLMNHLITEDMQAQQLDSQRKAKSLEMQIGMNKADEGRAEDLFQSSNLLAAARWNFVKRQAELIKGQVTDEYSKARATTISSQSDVRINQALLKAAQENVKERAAESRAWVPLSVAKEHEKGETVREGLKLSVGAVEKGLDRGLKEDLSKGAGGAPKGYETIGDPNGGADLGAVPKAERPKVTEFIRGTTEMGGLLNSIIERSKNIDLMSRRPDFLNTGSKEIHQLKADIGRLRAGMKGLDGFGARFTTLMNEIEKMETGGDSPDTWLTGDYTDRMEQTLVNMQNRVDIAARTLKINPWTFPSTDSSGRIINGSTVTPTGSGTRSGSSAAGMPSYMEKD